ncbi:MAG: glycine betaine ABC transporter substrate-binding protein, partial [Acidothermales bacterium]|nr:glycine betaine ABC transporter substrate-binding protein [Acidothermales bacterium]
SGGGKSLGGGGGGGGSGSKQVTIGMIPWDEDIAVTELWKQLLEAKGYKVTVQQLDAGPLFSGVASGSLSFFMDAWLPNTHAKYWKQFGPKVDDVGVWYEPADLGLAVPDYVTNVKTLADLKAHMSEFGGKVTGIEASAGEMDLAQHKVLPAYGIDSKALVQSSTPAMLAALQKAYSAKKPIVVTLWRPHWAFSTYKIHYLSDPKKAWGQPDKIHTIMSKKFAKNDPKVQGWLKNFKLNADQLQGLEKQTHNKTGAPLSAAVKTWVSQNKSLTDSWTK